MGKGSGYGAGSLGRQGRQGREGKFNQPARRLDKENRARRDERALHTKPATKAAGQGGDGGEEGEAEKDAALRASAARAAAAVKEVGRLRVEVKRLQDALQRQREGQTETAEREQDLRAALESMKSQLTEARFGNDNLRAQASISLPFLLPSSACSSLATLPFHPALLPSQYALFSNQIPPATDERPPGAGAGSGRNPEARREGSVPCASTEPRLHPLPMQCPSSEEEEKEALMLSIVVEQEV